ncbi:MAG: hypothetical protein H0T18_08810 [Chloroflexia bacterium]|nr:hypothetical protein [Chloroflexia bacterium]
MDEPGRSFAASDRELERALIDLGRVIAYPAAPDIASRVQVRLATEPEPHRHVSSRGTRDLVLRPPMFAEHEIPRGLGTTRGRRVLLVAACLLIVIVAGLVLFPEARTAIADRLGLRGVIIRWVDETPSPEPAPVGAPLLLGRQVTLEDARAAVDFRVHLPSADGFDSPAEVYLLGQGEDTMVSFVYPARPGLPTSEFIGVGALLTQFQGETDRGLIEKGLAEKTIDPETTLEYVGVGGETGFWITGAPHGFFLVCDDGGDCREERYRLAGNVLLWEQDGLTLRLESSLTRDEALAVAASMRATDENVAGTFGSPAR